MDGLSIKCPFCSVLKFSYKKCLAHIELQHHHLPNFVISCLHRNCAKTFKSVSSLRKHDQRTHKGSNLEPNIRNPVPEEQSENDNANIDGAEPSEVNVIDVGVSVANCTIENRTENPILLKHALFSNFQAKFTLFILKLQEKHILPQSVQSTIVDDVQFILKNWLQHYNELIKFLLTSHGYVLENNDELNDILSNDSVFDEALLCVTNEYQLQKYCANNLSLIKPQSFVLGTDAQGRLRSFQHVSIIKTLQCLLQNEDIYDCYQRNCTHIENGSLMMDYTDGTIFKEHLLFNNDRKILRLHFYTDEFEVVNVIGSKRGVHKISAFYYIIGNLDSKYNSHLDHIHLSTLVRHKFVKEYGYANYYSL